MITRRRLIRLLSIPAAALAALIVWLILVPLLGIHLEALAGGTTPMTVDAATTGLAAGLVAIPAWLALWAFERWTRHPARNFVIAAAVVLLVSAAGPLGGTSPAAVAGLVALHLVTAATIVGVLLASRSVGAASPAADTEGAVAYGDGR